MDRNTIDSGPSRVFVASVTDLRSLFAWFHEQGYTIVGPTIRDNAICLDALDSFDQLPVGWRESQAGGWYRLTPSDDGALFAHTVGPQSWKRYLSPPVQDSTAVTREGSGLLFSAVTPQVPAKLVFLGVRSCDLAALRILDKVYLDGPFVDTAYRERRNAALIFAVNCTRAGDACFCTSMGTGPRVTGGFDLALTECLEGGQQTFIVETGTGRGSDALAPLQLHEASPGEIRTAEAAVQCAAESMGRHLDTTDLPAHLKTMIDDRRWEEVAQRCLTCGNCTMVCPTCFCSTFEDSSNLTNSGAGRTRRWDSCFSVEFSYIHGGSIRPSAMARYRQWMMHKLAYWPEQFGTFGCVGCGRCIVWCPAGIDITEEANAFLKNVGR